MLEMMKTNFLQQWDQAMQEAQATGQPQALYKQRHMLAPRHVVARTMHPAFMGTRPAKFDPTRDQPDGK